MKNNLPYYTFKKNALIIRGTALSVMLLLIVAQLVAQEPPHYTMVANMPAVAQQSGFGMGALVWLFIALFFSLALNYLIRINEKKPEKAVLAETTALTEQKATAPNPEKSAAHKTSKAQPKYTHILQPGTALHLIKSSRHKVKVAS